ncbi:MAG: D-cysteine desulfhydrase family protein, partial [Anaerolineae bacterium]
TPVEHLPRLSAALGGPTLLVKRDDQTGLAFGGNKTRKLEYLLAEAQANGARTLITGGAAQSNHCRQTAAAAARFGFRCILVLAGEPPERASANLLLDDLFGAQIVWCTPDARDETMQQVFEQAWEAGERPFLIPYGGSSPTGAAAYAFAMQELLSQDVRPDWIVVASSSGGTQAGLAAGAHLFGFEGRVLGISIDKPEVELSAGIVAGLASQVCERLGQPHTFQPQDILVDDRFLGGGYGVMGEAEREAIRLFARHEGLLLDPVYTGRAAAALIARIRNGEFQRGEQVLFWHTGGTPALFADRYAPHL